MPELTPEQEKALQDLKIASDNLKKAAGGKVGETAETKYGEAYARCYKLGLKQWPPTVCKTTRQGIDKAMTFLYHIHMTDKENKMDGIDSYFEHKFNGVNNE